MRRRSLYVAVLCLLAMPLDAFAQEHVSSGRLMRHQIQSDFVEYPAAARAAHVQGTVVLQIQVGADGKVKSIKTISGPPMLIQAAKDCVKQRRYRPFEKNGSPVAVTGRVSLVFLLAGEKSSRSGNQPKKEETQPGSLIVVVPKVVNGGQPGADIAAKFFAARRECWNAMAKKQYDKSTAAICKKTADIAEQFPPDSHYIDKRVADVEAAAALRNSGDLVNALVYATKAVDVTNLGHDIDAGHSAAYGMKGAIEFDLGDLSASDHDLTASEDFGRKAIAWAKKEAPNDVTRYKRILAQELRFHANMLLHMNRADQAKKDLEEASSL